MNTEYAIENAKSMLETNLASTLIILQNEASSSIVTPTPQEYIIGEYDPETLTLYPAVLIWSPKSNKVNDQYGYQTRSIWIRVLVWITENNLEYLHRFLIRYSDAVLRVLRDESNWIAGLHNPVVENTDNTDLYKQQTVGYAQGTLIEGTVDYMLGEN